MRIAIAVAEHSGDNIAANLMRALKVQQPDVEVSGICGPAMVREGAQALYSIDDISSMGVEGLIGRIRKILKIRNDYIAQLLGHPPDVYVGIDAPDFNLPIQTRLRRAGIPTIQYIAPTVWAWRSYRIHKLKRAVVRLLTIYPFESALMEQAGIPHTYVGHPLADQIADRDSSPDRSVYGFAETDTVIAILPGSRINEVKRLAAVFLQTAMRLSEVEPGVKFIAPFANEETHVQFKQTLASMNSAVSVNTVIGDSLGVIEVSDLVIAASGTAALEAALFGKPVVVSYRLSLFSYWIVKILSKTNHYSMLNHFDGGPVIPEFMQNDCTAENLSREALKLLRDSNYREGVLERFKEIATALRQNSNVRVVEEITRVAAR